MRSYVSSRVHGLRLAFVYVPVVAGWLGAAARVRELGGTYRWIGLAWIFVPIALALILWWPDLTRDSSNAGSIRWRTTPEEDFQDLLARHTGNRFGELLGGMFAIVAGVVIGAGMLAGAVYLLYTAAAGR